MDLIAISNTNVSFTNKELATATDKIFKLGNAIKQNLYNVAFVMASVDSSECFKDDGFNNVHEWAMKTFGFKKSFSYSLLRIGKEYTREITATNKDGKTRVTGYSSNLLPENSGDDFTTTQIECMLPLGEYKDVADVVTSGKISPDMSCKRIKDVVKGILHPVTETTESEPEETESEPEETTATYETPTAYDGAIHFAYDPERPENHWFEINGEIKPVDDEIKKALIKKIMEW